LQAIQPGWCEKKGWVLRGGEREEREKRETKGESFVREHLPVTCRRSSLAGVKRGVGIIGERGRREREERGGEEGNRSRGYNYLLFADKGRREKEGGEGEEEGVDSEVKVCSKE
jgi:hypothetical protein